jgi:ribosome biogenesis GTPase A
MTGAKVDRNRAAGIVINDFRDGKLGQITLEKPESAAELKVEAEND